MLGHLEFSFWARCGLWPTNWIGLLYTNVHCVSVKMTDWLNLPISICITVFWVVFSLSKPNVACMQINSKVMWQRDDLDVDLFFIIAFIKVLKKIKIKTKHIYAVAYGNALTYFTIWHFTHLITATDNSQTIIKIFIKLDVQKSALQVKVGVYLLTFCAPEPC